jgi:thiol-disulfide isomerase/thioredoxin
MKIRITAFILLILFIAASPSSKVEIIKASYSTILANAENFKYTVVYLWVPYCSPCIGELKKLVKINKDNNVNLVLLTSYKQEVQFISNWGFDTSYYFDPAIYKTHTNDYDEFNQFTDEILKGVEIKNRDRAIYPALFILDRNNDLVYFGQDPLGKIDTSFIHKVISK